MENLTSTDIIFVCIIFLTWLTSLFLYGSEVATEGKKKQKSFESAKTVIDIAKYFLPLVALASIFSDHWLVMELFDEIYLKQIACAALLVGLIIFSLGKLTLGSQYSDCYNAFIPQKIITTGIYRFIRHPIYTGNLCILFAGFLFSGSLWALAVLIVMTFTYGKTVVLEELELVKNIPGYSTYQKQSGAIFPVLSSFTKRKVGASSSSKIS